LEKRLKKILFFFFFVFGESRKRFDVDQTDRDLAINLLSAVFGRNPIQSIPFENRKKF